MPSLKYWDGTAWQNLAATGASAPVGTVMAYAGTVTPTGWLLCDGSTYNISTWPALGAMLGSGFGGDGTTTFAVPDLRDRFVLGKGSTYGMNAAGGEINHTLTIAEMAEHYHTNHMAASPGPGGVGDMPYRGNGSVDPSFRSGYPGLFSNNAYGSGQVTANQPHNNMPPYRALAYIIKAAAGGEQALAPDMVGATSVAVSVTGASATAPGPTTGTAFTTPAGVFRGIFVAGGWNSANSGIRVDLYIDGVQVGISALNTSHVLSAHQTLQPVTFSVNVTAGTHYAYARLITGNSDSDLIAMFGTVTPATGSLAEPATVLNARLTADLALSANAFNRVTGWTVLHSYPVWTPESAGQFAVPSDGYYRVDFHGQATAGGTLRASAVFINGAQAQQYNVYTNVAGSAPGMSAWWEGNLKSGDLVDIRVYPDVAVTLSSSYPGNVWLTKLVIRKIYSGGIPGGQGAPDTPWVPLTLLNGWTNYGAPFSTLSYRRISGVVYIKGFVATGAAGTAVATLPAGFRPAQTKLLGGYYNGGMARVDIDANGVIVPSAYTSWLSLEQIVFPADQ